MIYKKKKNLISKQMPGPKFLMLEIDHLGMFDEYDPRKHCLIPV